MGLLNHPENFGFGAQRALNFAGAKLAFAEVQRVSLAAVVAHYG